MIPSAGLDGRRVELVLVYKNKTAGNIREFPAGQTYRAGSGASGMLSTPFVPTAAMPKM